MTDARKKVVLLHMGGTLGMQGSPLHPGAYGQRLVEHVPEITHIAELDIHILCNLDSSDVGPEEWTLAARTIEAARQEAAGFVILHGTDSMAFTASALAFSLKGLDRPVVMTGAQRPLVAHRTDARRNLVDAVELATCDLPEVGVCFDGLLLRGCRAVKGDARSYHAFHSPGCEPLARMGVDVDVSDHVRRPSEPFECDPRFDARVAVVYVTPGLEPATIEGMLDSRAAPRGIVLAAFGVGTVPTRKRALAPVVRRAVEGGVPVVVVNQRAGRVDLGLYENSLALADAGAIPGGEMSTEAATVKLMSALARCERDDALRAFLMRDVAGERE